ncbi:hypothetical protein ACFDTO_29790 [Microbacteriaceae bacterium 4G12]
MKLYPLLFSFVQYAKVQHHLEPLLPLQEKVIRFQFQEECYSLHVARHEIKLSNMKDGTDTIVFSHEEDARHLLTGAVRLQPLLRRKGMEYKGTYRTMLLLESLFHICKPLDARV